MAWSIYAGKLYVSSLDGSVLLAVFEKGDLGYATPFVENAKQLLRYKRKENNINSPIILVDEDNESTGLSFLESHNEFLLALTATGLLYVWNINTLEALCTAISIAPILDHEMSATDDGIVSGPRTSQCVVTPKGIPFVSVTNEDGFLYNTNMKAWLRVSET